MNLLPLLALAALPHGLIQVDLPSQDAAMLPIALRKLDAMKEPEIIANRDTLQAVLERFYLHRETMKSSEFKLIDAFLEAASAGRNGSTSRLAAMVRVSSSPAATKPPKSGKASNSTASPSKPNAVSFASSVHRNPGGQSVGVVELKRAGVRTPLIEVYPGGGLSVSERARVIASRFDRLSAMDPFWWMKLKVGAYKASTIVASPRAESGIVVTADASFAEACGTDPQGLARMLINKIREGIEPGQGGNRSVGNDPELDLADAVDARQRGDNLAGANPKGAAKAYEEAMDLSPSYVVAYLRLSLLHVENGDKAAAKDVLEKGLLVDAMSEAGKRQLRAALIKLD